MSLPQILTAEARVDELRRELADDADAVDQHMIERLRRALADRLLELAPVTHDRIRVGVDTVYRVSTLAPDAALFDALDLVTIAAERLATRERLDDDTVRAIDEIRAGVRLARLAYARQDRPGGPT